MNAMQKIKLSNERIALIKQIKSGTLKASEKIKASRRVTEIVTLLGGKKPPVEPILTKEGADQFHEKLKAALNVDLTPFERIVRDNEITIETLTGAIESTKQLLDSEENPPIFVQAIQVVSDSLENGTLFDGLGQAGLELFNELTGMFDTSYGSEDTDKAQKNLIAAFYNAGWDQGSEHYAANFMKYGERCAFSIDNKQYSFTVVVKQKNTTAVEDKLSSNGISNLDEVYQFINRYIENEENKIQQPSAVDYAKRLEDMQQRKDPMALLKVAKDQFQKHFDQSGVDLAAQTAETSQFNTDQPPQADLENDAYRKAEIEIAGMRIAIENPVGSVRRGVDNQGNAWETVMKAHYGYFLNTLGEDGDEIDVFVVEGTEHDYNGRVFILYQIDENGAFDEHKVILGTTSKIIATKIYQEHYDENFNGIAAIKELSIEDFKEWLKNPNDGMFDGVGAQMFDNWLADGKFDLVPIKMLNIEHLELLNEPNPGAREPIVIFKKGNDLQVVQGSRRLKLAQKIGEKFVPSIILDQKEGYNLQIIKKAIKKCGSVVHAEALAAMAFQCVENEAMKNL